MKIDHLTAEVPHGPACPPSCYSKLFAQDIHGASRVCTAVVVSCELCIAAERKQAERKRAACAVVLCLWLNQTKIARTHGAPPA